MEKRRKLNLADLHVESFDTAASAALRGTVYARADGAQSGASCGGYCTEWDCTVNWDCKTDEWDCDSFGCGSNQPQTCYAGCEDTCRNTYTSQYAWRSCDHSACWDGTCAGPADSCKPLSYPVVC